MADDIDIEEHDVMESLRRRQPDVVVKTEPPDYAEPQYGETAAGYYQNQWDWPQTTEAPKIKLEPAEEEFQFGKIILGTKPPAETPDQLQPEDTPETRENYNYNMSLVLDDWGPTLESSNCYCPECLILFATVNALDAHKMLAHSFLVPAEKEASPERNKAVKSTAKTNDDYATCQICKYEFKGIRAHARSNLMRHYRDVHKVDPNTDDLRDWKICNHCNVYFPSDTALVKHLYELLPLNDKNTPTKDEKKAPVRVQSAVKSTTGLNVKAKPHTVVNTERIVKVQTVNDKKTPAKDEKKAPVRVQKAVKSTTDLNVKAKTPTVVKDVKNVNAIVKKENSLILGTKVNVNSENVEEQSNFSKTMRKCEVCGIEYSKKYYLKHMGRFHPDFLMAKKAKLKKMAATSTVATTRYKCTLCHQVIVGKSAAKRHRLTHPQLGRRKILKIMKTKKVIAKPQPVEKKVAQTEENVNIIVAKSTVFKCNRCSVHFLTCYGACAHSRVCETSGSLREWKCPQCERIFKTVDRKAHEVQHKNYSSRFKVYVVYSEMVIRILCECPKCHVCFEEYKFWRHVNFGCERDAESFYCNECRLPIDATSKNSHESKHTQGDFTKEDFIKVDFVSSRKEPGTVEIKTEIATPEKVPLKRKIKVEEEIPIKKRKTRDEFHLFFCPSCKCYSHIKVRFHMEKKCKKVVYKNGFTRKPFHRQSCNICALSFSYKTLEPHKKLHEKYPDLTLTNLVFTRITDDKKIKPPLENFPCKRCQVTFTTKESRSTHACGATKTAECQVCQKKIERQAFAAHMRFHNYVIPNKAQLIQREAAVEVKSPNEIKPNLKRNEVTPMTQNLPELLMKYKSLTTQWNILYLCDTCDTFTDSYDKVVEHCQNHYTNMESYGVVIMKCQICNMKFDRECYRRHLELHAGSKVISRKSFKILTYDHSRIFFDDWLNFMDLPEDQKTQILNRSIYGEARSVRLKLVQQGPPEFTVYRCVQCLKCVPPESLTHHINLQNCLKANKVICSFCEMVFVNRTTCDQHELLHQTNSLQANSFRIIAFNDSITEFNKPKTDASEDSAKDDVVTEEPRETSYFLKFHSDNVKTIKGKNFYMFYKCAGCDVCMLSESGSKKHVCSHKKKITCNKCGLKFSMKYLSVHARLHAKYDFSDKNVFTKTFNNKKGNDNKDVINRSNSSTAIESKKTQNENKDGAKLYKCHCGLHYTSLKSIEKHYQAKNCGLVVREKCSQCNLIFDPLEIVNHLCKHHAKAQVKSFDVIMPTKKTLYKCNQCHVLFYDRNVAIIHKGKCEGMASGTKCEQCGLAFHRSSIEKHRDDHKTGGSFKTDCYIVVNIPNDQTSSALLFKCKECDVNFLLRPTLYHHVVYYNHRMIKIMQCKECGLKFSHTSLPKHVDLHHVKRKVVDFEFRYIDVGVKWKPEIEDKTNETSQEEESEEEIESVEEDNVTQLKPVKECQIYKCKKCALHFMDENTLFNHNDDRCSKETSEICDLCDIKFAARHMKEHRKQHDHNELSMSVVDYSDRPESETNVEETDEDQTTNIDKLYKCHKCELHFNSKDSLKKHINKCVPNVLLFKCDECGLGFTKNSLTRHKGNHPKSFEVVTLTDLEIKRVSIPPTVAEESQSQPSKNEVVSLDSSFELESTDSQEKAQIKLYKCGDCNVYFLTQRVCYKHVIKHIAMDAKEYIECKLCGFQFTIMALQSHIKKHHTIAFNLEEVLVEEYQPNDLTNNVPKIEIYYAIDKYQSRLVSTTSDVKNDPKVVEVDAIGEDEAKKAENEVTSNSNELIEKIDANQNDSQVVENEMDVVVNDLKDVQAEV